jgi:hypothetical protein
VCVYYESIKRELKTRPIYGVTLECGSQCRDNERLKTKDEESTRLGYLFIINRESES